MEQRFWLIEGYEDLTKIYDRKVKLGCFSDKQIKTLLKALTAKAGLSYDEIVGAYAKKKTNIANELLFVKKDVLHPVYTCGDGPYFIAQVVIEEL